MLLGKMELQIYLHLVIKQQPCSLLKEMRLRKLSINILFIQRLRQKPRMESQVSSLHLKERKDQALVESTEAGLTTMVEI